MYQIKVSFKKLIKIKIKQEIKELLFIQIKTKEFYHNKMNKTEENQI